MRRGEEVRGRGVEAEAHLLQLPPLEPREHQCPLSLTHLILIAFGEDRGGSSEEEVPGCFGPEEGKQKGPGPCRGLWKREG